MNTIENLTGEILGLAMIANLVATPEQRNEWARQADWNHYVSKYTD